MGFFRSSISLTNPGTTFLPDSPMETALKTVSVSSILRCSKHCNDNEFCRTFIYNSASLICQLYQSDLQTGNITVTNTSTSRVGLIRYSTQFYTNYNTTCDQCRTSRYLICRNDRCQCPFPTTFWNGQMCQNQFYYGASCVESDWCRNDLNLSCIYGACQLSTAVCRLGTTSITFDDIPNIDPCQGTIPSIYNGLNWDSGYYLRTSCINSTGYSNALGSGLYVAWTNNYMAMQSTAINQFFTFVSCSMAAGWSDSQSVVVAGYNDSVLLHSTNFTVSQSTKTNAIFNWPGLTKVIFNAAAATGFDNICITF